MNEQELAELDLAVAGAEGVAVYRAADDGSVWQGNDPYRPTRDGAEAMRLLEKYRLVAAPYGGGWTCWRQLGDSEEVRGNGPTPAVAICRAVVALCGAERRSPEAKPGGTAG